MSQPPENEVKTDQSIRLVVLPCDHKEALIQALVSASSKSDVSIEVVDHDVALLMDHATTLDPQMFEKACVEPAVLEGSGFQRTERDYESVFKKKGGVRRR